MSDLEQDPIDAVVTWVDGSDPKHIVKRNATLEVMGRLPPDTIPAGVDQTRFADNNEIEFCVRSIRKFAPWIRTIFLVTDEQCPAFLTIEERLRLGVTLVDHREIFAGHEGVLPTFNSLSIETVLHRIPGLAERFLYFNDDFILLQPVKPSDFFLEHSVVLRGEWSALPDFGPLRIKVSSTLNVILKKLFRINRAMSVLQQIRAAQLAGFRDRYFKVAHAPYPIKRRTLEEFFEKDRESFLRNIQYRFRSLDQYATTVLANHLEISRKWVVYEGAEQVLMICFHRDRKAERRRKLAGLREQKYRFLCVQSMEEASLGEIRDLTAQLKSQVYERHVDHVDTKHSENIQTRVRLR